MRPLCIDLFCGLGGWAEGFLAEGYDVIGFDVERHDYGTGGYPGQLVLKDVLTLHGSQFREAACIVASPPCQKYSYMAMPWGRAKMEIAWQKWFRDSGSKFADPFTLNDLFNACFRIRGEASEAAGREIPLVVENVKGAQPWVGRAAWHYGSFYLWGDVPALMPFAGAVKVSGRNWSGSDKPGYVACAFNDTAVARLGQKLPPGNCVPGRWADRDIQRLKDATKNNGGSWFNVAHNTESGTGQNPDGREIKGTGGLWFTSDADGRTKQGHWRDGGCVTRCYNSKDSRRKAASAQIAKIPFPLANHIARVFYPRLAILPAGVGGTEQPGQARIKA